MGQKSSIEWCHHTFNPWVGCQRVSAGCEHCYAEAMARRTPALVLGTGYKRVAQNGHEVPPGEWGRPVPALPVWGPQANRRVTSDANWKLPLRWDRAAVRATPFLRALSCSAVPRPRVFCASLADAFENRRDLDPHRSRLWDLIAVTPNLDWLLLTKRPRLVMRMVPEAWQTLWPANVWIGCTVEDQRAAEERLPYLLGIPAPVRFVSYEPALEGVDFTKVHIDQIVRHLSGISSAYLNALTGLTCQDGPRHIDWLIIGGESGPGARPFDLAWARWTLEQCRRAGVPVFVKQLGARPIESSYITRAQSLGHIHDDPKGGDMDEWPADLRVREFPRVIEPLLDFGALPPPFGPLLDPLTGLDDG